MSGELAIRLRGVVKRYGPITAVGGLDLDVPTGTCVGLLGPNGAGKSTTMRMLTAQSIADEGELEVLGFQLPRDSKQARAQCGVVPQLDNLDVSLTVEQNLLVFAHLYRIGRHDRPAAIERSLELANLVDRRDTRVDKLSGGMRRRLLIARALVHQPRLVLMDEPTVGLDPQVRQQLWALIDRLRYEGTTILMSTHYIEEAQRLADTVLIMSHGEGVARGKPADLVLEHAGREVLEVYGPPKRLGPGARWTQRLRLRGRAQAGEPRGRVRAPHRRGDRLVAAAARTAKIGRLERPALTGVLVREIVNFSSYWRAATFSSTVEPTIYLLAFGFGFGSLVSTINGYSYVQFVGTGTVATAVLFSSAFAAMFGTFVKYQFQRTYDAILAAPVDTEELVTAESIWIAVRAGVYGCVPMVVAIFFGLDPSWGMLTVPFIGFLTGLGWANFGIMTAGYAKAIENFNYIVSAVLTPLFLLAGTFFPLDGLPRWLQVLAELNPLHQCVELVRAAVLYGFEWNDLLRVGVLVVFALIMWRIAIHAMERKLID
jgi:lipooligosaccharide transport system permease protein